MSSKARLLAEFISSADVDSDEIATGAVSPSKLADTLDLTSKTITLPTIAGDITSSGILKSTRANYAKVSLVNTDTSQEWQVQNNGTNFRITDQTQSGATRLAINASGYVGIGTISPAGRFHVVGSGGVTGGTPQNSGSGNQIVIENNASGGSADIQLLGPTNGYNHIFFGDADDANVGVIYYSHVNNSLNFTTNANSGSAVLASNGKFGIGTPTPGDELTVVGQALFSYTDIAANSSAQYAQVEIQKTNADANWSYLAFHETGSIAWQQGILDNKFVIASTGGVAKTSTDAERFTIDTSGRVGVGITNPSASLDVVSNSASGYVAEFRESNASNFGTILIDSPTDGESRPSYMDYATGGTVKWSTGLAYLDTARSFHIGTGSGLSNSKVTIDTSGKVGVGTTGPGERIHVYGSGQQFIKVETTTTGAAAFVGMRMQDGDGDLGSIGDFGSGRRAFMLDTGSGVDMMFFTNNQNNSSDIPRMTINSSGKISIGTSLASNDSNGTLHVGGANGGLSVGGGNHGGYHIFSQHEGNVPANTTRDVLQFEGPAFARYLKVTVSGYLCQKEVYFYGYQSWNGSSNGNNVGSTVNGTQTFGLGTNSGITVQIECTATTGTSAYPRYKLKIITGGLSGQLYDTTVVAQFFNPVFYPVYL